MRAELSTEQDPFEVYAEESPVEMSSKPPESV